MTAASDAALPGRRPRDPRLDVFRGAGMFIILFAHIPWNGWADWIPARFGFSDATEIFVFCSGVASSLAFGRVFAEAGMALGTARIAHRVWQIWWAHIGVFIMVVALLAAADHAAGSGHYLRGDLNLGAFLDDPGTKLFGLVTLTYVPNYFDILPMYLAILAMIPVAMLVVRKAGYAAFAALSFALWTAAFLGKLDLPADPETGRTWFFNPFSWQFIFFLGFAFGRGWLPLPRFDRRLVVAAAAMLIAAAPFACHFGFACYAGWGFAPWLGEAHQALGMAIDKTYLGPLRVAHFLALAYVAYILAGDGGRRVAARAFDPVRLVGRQSLAIFLTGLVLAQALGVALDHVGRSAGTVAAANVGGCLVLIAVAAIVEWFKRAPWAARAQKPAPRREPAPMTAVPKAAAGLAALALFVGVAPGPARGGEVLMDRRAESPALGHPIVYSLYRPAAAPPPGQRWPVLYLLHGLGDSERAWPDLGHVQATLDRLIADGRIKPLLVVMPMAARSWYVDDPDPGGFGPAARALTGDLVAAIDAAYPTAACREGRAVGGLSMGGYGALLYAMDNPRLYAAAFSFSGSLFRPMPEDETARAQRVTRMFNTVFGNPFDWQRFNRWNLFLKGPAYIADRERTPFYLAIGSEDFPALKEGNILFRDTLAAAGVTVPFRIDPGGHTWTLWSAQLGPAVEWANGVLSATCGKE